MEGLGQEKEKSEATSPLVFFCRRCMVDFIRTDQNEQSRRQIPNHVELHRERRAQPLSLHDLQQS